MPPKKGRDAPAPGSGGIRAFFVPTTPTTPLRNVTNIAMEHPTTAPPLRAKSSAVRNIKFNQIAGPAAGGAARAAVRASHMPGSPPGEDDIMYSGTSRALLHLCPSACPCDSL